MASVSAQTAPATFVAPSVSAEPVVTGSAARPDTGGMQPLILDVQINGQAVDTTHPLMRRGAQILFAKSELDAWQLVIPGAPVVSVNGTDYYDLLVLPGIKLLLDEATQTMMLEVPPKLFRDSLAKTRSPARPPPSESVFGAFLNYDVALQHDSTGTHPSGYFDAAVSDERGLVATNFVTGRSAFAAGRSTTRLDTYYRFDDPNALTRLTVGDTIARSAIWSTPFRYGGVQFGTQFGLQPGYISYPTPTLRSSSGLPSAVEVYVNNTLRYQGRADAGPFSVPNVPVLTGAGEMRLAMTDALGVQHTVTTPYYVSSNLLRSGLSDYSVEFGWNRLLYGERSFDYGRPFGSGTWRKGIDDTTTVELHGEVGMTNQTLGGGITLVMATIGEFAAHAAASHSSDMGSGRLLRTSFTRSSANWSLSASRQTASRNFTQVGWQDSTRHIDGQSQLFAGRSLGRYGSLGSSYTLLHYNTGEQIAVLSANWSIAIAGGSLSTYVARTHQQSVPDATSIGLTFAMALDVRQMASVSMQRLAGHNTTTLEVDRTPPADIDGGYGYRVAAAQGQEAHSEAHLDWLGRYGAATAEAANYRGETALRARVSGAIGSAGGLLFATRQSNDAFALVTVPGAAGLNIYRENQHLATTDNQGRAIISGLRAYEPNRISINSEDIPIETRIGKDTIQVVPRYKSVAAVTFDITRYTVANIVVRLDNGLPLPPGVEVHSAGGRATALLSGYGGAVSIDAPRANERFEARWRTGQCTFTLGALDEAGKLIQSGAYVCTPLVTTTQ